MKANQPVGNPAFAPVYFRVALGAYFALAGFSKLQIIPDFIKEVEKFNVLPASLVPLYGTLLPYCEIAVGVLLVFGLWMTLASALASLMLLSFIIAVGLFPSTLGPFNKDIILLAGAVGMMYSGGGAFSVDKLREG